MSNWATSIASAVEEQGTATQEISRNVLQAAQGTQEVSGNIAPGSVRRHSKPARPRAGACVGWRAIADRRRRLKAGGTDIDYGTVG